MADALVLELVAGVLVSESGEVAGDFCCVKAVLDVTCMACPVGSADADG